MPNYDNTNSGTLYVNKDKRSSSSPDRTGSAEVACPHCGAVSGFFLSGWVKTAGEKSKIAGQKFMSLAFTAKDAPGNSQKSGPDNFDDDIPF